MTKGILSEGNCFLAPVTPAVKKKVLVTIVLVAGTSLLFAQATPPGAPSPPQKLRNHFDTDAFGSPPAYFDFLVLGAPGEAQWKVTWAPNVPSPPNKVSQVIAVRPNGSIAVAIRRNIAFRDGVLSLALQKGSGKGGLLFRMRNEKDFLALLVDLDSGDARLTAYENSRPIEIARGKASLEAEWGDLSVTAEGPRITATWNGKPLLQGTDQHPISGRTGMATEGPGSVSFDEFVLEAKE